jgi:hypothetical protein
VSSPAKLFTRDRADGSREFLIDCPYAYTISAAPRETLAELGDDAIARVALARHALECDRCDKGPLWDTLGDEPESAEECRLVGQEMRRAYARGRRN